MRSFISWREGSSLGLDTSAFKILEEELLQVFREMLGTLSLEEDTQRKRGVRDGQ